MGSNAVHLFKWLLSSLVCREPQGLQLLAATLGEDDTKTDGAVRMLSQQAASFASFRRRWTNQLALQTMQAFRALFDAYRCERGVCAILKWFCSGGSFSSVFERWNHVRVIWLVGFSTLHFHFPSL